MGKDCKRMAVVILPCGNPYEPDSFYRFYGPLASDQSEIYGSFEDSSIPINGRGRCFCRLSPFKLSLKLSILLFYCRFWCNYTVTSYLMILIADQMCWKKRCLSRCSERNG